jgi:hypothetical protein
MTTSGSDDDGDDRAEVNKLVDKTKKELAVIAAQERQIVKDFLWDLYAEQGMHPHQMRLAFDEAIAYIEREEARFEEEEEVER